MYMVEAAGDGDESAQGQLAMVKELVARSDMLLDGLKKLASPSDEDESKLVVTAEAIRARKMPASMHVFLQNLAVAEGMLA